MRTLWRFSINSVQVEEPIGWDQVEITIQRSDNFHGLENIYSDNITFWDNGAQIIKAAYDTDGIDADLTLLVEYSCDGGLTYQTWITGILNCMFYSIINNEVSIKIEPTGFHRTVKNRLDTPVNLFSNVSTGGVAMSTINAFDLGLHSKAILFQSKLIQNTGIVSYFVDNSGGGGTRYMSWPFVIDINELFETREPATIEPAEPIFYSGSSYVFGETIRTIRVSGRIKFEWEINGSFIDLFVEAKTGGGDVLFHDQLLFATGITGSFDELFDFSYDLPADTYINIFARFDVSGSGQSINFIFDNVSFVELEENSVKPSSTASSFLIHEVFAKVAESITDIPDSFRSNFFGRTNSQPHQYDSNGCGAWTAVTNGLNIRKMLDKDGNLFPIVTTFNDLFQACDAVWNLGMRIEKDINGKEYIRVEPKEFFYNGSAILTTLNVSDLKRSPASDFMYNDYQVGYEKWNLNITGSNALDEFNSQRKYTLPLLKAKKQLVTMSKYIASGYVIEQTRRLQYNSVPTNDFETDNDLFFICTNIDTVESDLYTTPPVVTSYAAGTVSERDENFTGITNVLSPSTVYNYRISPVRMALNWYKYLGASLFKKVSPVITFRSGQGNYQEGDTMTDSCNHTGPVVQNQNLVAGDLEGNQATPLFLGEYLDFTYPLSMSDFILIMNNSEKGIQVSCDGMPTYLGFVKEVKNAPNSEEATNTTFRLLRGVCVLGDFNGDFSEDFFIGNCI